PLAWLGRVHGAAADVGGRPFDLDALLPARTAAADGGQEEGEGPETTATHAPSSTLSRLGTLAGGGPPRGRAPAVVIACAPDMTSDVKRFTGTSTYLTNEALEASVNCALVLEKPLLVRGEPGT